MSVYPAGSRAGSTVVLSPRQFHDRVETALRHAMASHSAPGGTEEGLRMLSALLQEVPSLSPGARHQPGLPALLTEAVRRTIDGRADEAAAGSARLLADLLELVLAFYPEAVPPEDL
jgi:hypothetical protein